MFDYVYYKPYIAEQSHIGVPVVCIQRQLMTINSTMMVM